MFIRRGPNRYWECMEDMFRNVSIKSSCSAFFNLSTLTNIILTSRERSISCLRTRHSHIRASKPDTAIETHVFVEPPVSLTLLVTFDVDVEGKRSRQFKGKIPNKDFAYALTMLSL